MKTIGLIEKPVKENKKEKPVKENKPATPEEEGAKDGEVQE